MNAHDRCHNGQLHDAAGDNCRSYLPGRQQLSNIDSTHMRMCALEGHYIINCADDTMRFDIECL